MLVRKDNQLYIEQPGGDLNLLSFCKTQQNPFYLYDLDGVKKRYREMRSSFNENYQFHYALKANHNSEIVKALAALGANVDVVSIGEMKCALSLGMKASQVVFSGVAKTKLEIREALKLGVGQINVESEPEFRRIFDIAKDMGLKAPISFRVNPDVEAETHPYIRTGMKENKFGVEFSKVDQMLKSYDEWKGHIALRGISLHIGSQIRDPKPFIESVQKSLARLLEWQLLAPELVSLDLGGGVGIDYGDAEISKDLALWKSYAEGIRSLLDPVLKSGQLKEVILEPGRFLVGRFGFLLAEVQYIKSTPFKKFVIVNTGMHHLMRPALYQAFHRIEAVQNRTSDVSAFDVVGPICESSDVVGHDRMLPSDIREGDWVLVADAGAYGQVMKNDYNMHPEAAEIVLSEGKAL